MGYGFIDGKQNQPILEQEIDLVAGWNLVSFYVKPVRETLIQEIFADYTSDINIVQDSSSGGIWYPSASINSINTWDSLVGYKIRAYAGFTLKLKGTLISPRKNTIALNTTDKNYSFGVVGLNDPADYTDVVYYTVATPNDIFTGVPIATGTGWKVVPLFSKVELPVVDVFASIVGDINIVKDDAGNIYWPAFGVDIIGNMVPGEGYQVSVNTNTVLTYSNI